ncbi:MAG: flavodoxin family protein [Clostridiales Family XIII bacterium]|jgi:multimeric flavodoxin WrbA|nr:flavodoxin family protein [Clostridiales Family XIII bacterium]
MGKNIVVLSGSPRQNGTTDVLAAALTEGAEAAGNAVACFRTADLTIGACLGCGQCFKNTGICVQKDGMLPILEKLREADVLVLASPVYFFGFTAQLKCVIDRTYALLKEGTHIKRAALLVTCGGSTDAAAASVLSTFRQIAGYQGWEEAGTVVVPGLHRRADIEGREELEQARKLGAGL